MASALGVPVLAGKLADELSDHGRHPQRQQVAGTGAAICSQRGILAAMSAAQRATIGYS